MSNVDRYKIEEVEKWKDFTVSMPFIKFPPDWEIQMMAPFNGALARFRVKLPSGAEKSIYFDAHNALGYMDGPYWEVYPHQGDVGRCYQHDVAELLKMIADESPESSHDQA